MVLAPKFAGERGHARYSTSVLAGEVCSNRTFVLASRNRQCLSERTGPANLPNPAGGAVLRRSRTTQASILQIAGIRCKRKASKSREGYPNCCDGVSRPMSEAKRDRPSAVPKAQNLLLGREPLVEWLCAQAGVSRWGLTRERFAEALGHSAAKHFAGMMPSAEDLEGYLRGL